MPEETSKTGLWIDADGKLVKKQPEGSATQIVREGGRIDSSAKVRLASLEADPDAEPIPAAEALAMETADALTVETAADTSKSGKRKSK